MQNFYLFSIQAGPKVIKIAVSQLQFLFGVGKGRTQYEKLKIKISPSFHLAQWFLYTRNQKYSP